MSQLVGEWYEATGLSGIFNQTDKDRKRQTCFQKSCNAKYITKMYSKALLNSKYCHLQTQEISEAELRCEQKSLDLRDNMRIKRLTR